jgi:hypothetical protein
MERHMNTITTTTAAPRNRPAPLLPKLATAATKEPAHLAAEHDGRLNHSGARKAVFNGINPERQYELVIAGEWPVGRKARIEVKAVVGIGERTYRVMLSKDTVIRLPYRTARVETIVSRTSKGLDLDLTVVRRLEARGDW